MALVQVFVVITICEAVRTMVLMVLNFESMICTSVVQCMFHTLDVFHLKDLQRSQGANKKMIILDLEGLTKDSLLWQPGMS